jgi:hypothetical protein
MWQYQKIQFPPYRKHYTPLINTKQLLTCSEYESHKYTAWAKCFSLLNAEAGGTYCDVLGDTSEMNVATQRSGTD